jgi:hypothetical protein
LRRALGEAAMVVLRFAHRAVVPEKRVPDQVS